MGNIDKGMFGACMFSIFVICVFMIKIIDLKEAQPDVFCSEWHIDSKSISYNKKSKTILIQCENDDGYNYGVPINELQ